MIEVLNCNNFILKLQKLMEQDEFDCVIFQDIAGDIVMNVTEDGENKTYITEYYLGNYPSEAQWFSNALNDMYETIQWRRINASAERRRVHQEAEEGR
jgi:hypothetical protein